MTTTAPVVAPRRNVVVCPTCKEPIDGGLLAVCRKPFCREVDSYETWRQERNYG